MVSETSSEAISAMAMVRANGRNSSPVDPLTNEIGKKTATVVMVDAVMAPATSRTAPTMVSALSTPATRWRLMFSITTIESSTTRPIAMVRAPRVRMLSE